jgi:hypothetical protein
VRFGDVAEDADEEIDAAVGPGVSGGADDQGRPEPASGQQHHLQVVDLPLSFTDSEYLPVTANFLFQVVINDCIDIMVACASYSSLVLPGGLHPHFPYLLVWDRQLLVGIADISFPGTATKQQRPTFQV